MSFAMDSNSLSWNSLMERISGGIIGLEQVIDLSFILWHTRDQEMKESSGTLIQMEWMY